MVYFREHNVYQLTPGFKIGGTMISYADDTNNISSYELERDQKGSIKGNGNNKKIGWKHINCDSISPKFIWPFPLRNPIIQILMSILLWMNWYWRLQQQTAQKLSFIKTSKQLNCKLFLLHKFLVMKDLTLEYKSLVESLILCRIVAWEGLYTVSLHKLCVPQRFILKIRLLYFVSICA